MVIGGHKNPNTEALGYYLTSQGKNEKAELWEIKGTVADNVWDALYEMDAIGKTTRAEGSFYSAHIDPEEGEQLTKEQLLKAVDILEKSLGFEGNQRIVVYHNLAGREHLHIAWSRINLENMKAVDIYKNFEKHELARLQCEKEFGLEHVNTAFFDENGQRLTPEQRRAREKAPHRSHVLKGKEPGHRNPYEVKNEVRAAKAQADSGKAFVAALRDYGLILAKGDDRDFVIVDQGGGNQNLARILKERVAEVRKFLANVDPLPSVAQAQELQATITRTKEAAANLAEAAGVKKEPPQPEKPDYNGKIKAAIGTSKDGLDLIAALQKDGLQIARDKWGRFVAVAPDGYEYAIKGKGSAPLLESIRAQEAAGLIIETSDEVRKGRRAEREAAREERRAVVDRFLDNLKKAELGKTQGEIRLAYSLAPSGAAFMEALGERGLILAKVSEKDAERSEQSANGRVLDMGAYCAVSLSGFAYPLNLITTGAPASEIEKRLGPIDQNKILDVEAAQNVQRERLAEMQRPELGQVQGEIRLAYGLSQSGAGFVDALEARGLILARASEKDVLQSKNMSRLVERQGSYAQTLKVGGFYVVARNGHAYALNQKTTGANSDQITKYLATTEKSLLSVNDAKDVMADVRKTDAKEYAQQRVVFECRTKANGARHGATLGAGMVSQQNAAMRRLQAFHKSQQPAPKHPDEEAKLRAVGKEKAAQTRKDAAQEATSPAALTAKREAEHRHALTREQAHKAEIERGPATASINRGGDPTPAGEMTEAKARAMQKAILRGIMEQGRRTANEVNERNKEAGGGYERERER